MRSAIKAPVILLVSLMLMMGLRLPRAFAAGAAIQLTATRTTLLADGKQTTTLRALVRDSTGRYAPEGTNVNFQISGGGTLSPPVAQTHGGYATVTLTSSPIAGISYITATGGGGVSQTLEILFTDDPSATFQGNNYMLASSSSYLAYSATDKVIEAIGKDGGARIAYRNLEISADRMQLRCSDLILRARDNVTIKKAGKTIKLNRLYYSLQSGEGFAVGELDGRLQTLEIAGENLRIQASRTPIPTSYINFPDLQVKLNIVARSITFFPNDRLQFRRAKFYQDEVQILSLPYYELGLNSQELFSDQFISVGTSGFGLELPVYYDLSPRTSGVVYLRHQQPLGRGYYTTEPGWAIDVLQGYSSLGDHRYEGSYGFTGLTRSDWGFRFNHNQEFNSRTQASFDLQFPRHDSIFSSVNFSHQLQAFRLGGNYSGGQTFTSDHTTSSRGDLFVETVPHPFFHSRDYAYTFGTTYTDGQTRSTLSGVTNYHESSENVNLRVFAKPIPIDKRTSFTNSFSLGHTWSDTGGTGATALATLGLDHTLPGGGSINVTFDYVNQPSGVYNASGRERLSATYNLQSRKRFSAFIFGSMYLDANEASILADATYRLDSRWRFIGAVTLQRFGSDSYSDIEFIVGRRIGARELQFGYSTLKQRFSFDFTATRF